MGPNLPGKNSGLPNGEQAIKASGPSASPVFYLELSVAGTPTIYRLQGPLNGSATLTAASGGPLTPHTHHAHPAHPPPVHTIRPRPPPANVHPARRPASAARTP